MVRRVTSAVLSSLLLGCASSAVDAGDTGTSPFSFELDPLPIVVEAGEAVDVTVTVVRAPGFDDPVTVTWVGAPEGLRAEVGPSPARQQSTLTLSPSADLVPARYQGWLRGEADGLLHASPVPVDVVLGATRDVRGRVVDALGAPLPDLVVSIGEVDATSDDEGWVRFEAVDAPYTAMVHDPSNGTYHVYAELTRPNPVFHVLNRFPVPTRAVVSGTLAGGAGFPLAPSQVTAVAASSSTTGSLTGSRALFDGEGPSYGSVQLSWLGSDDPVDITMHALQWTFDGALLPRQYTGYGSATAAVGALGSTTGVDISLAAVETGFLAGEVRVPGGHTVDSRAVWLQLGDGAAVGLLHELTADATFSYAVPRTDHALGVQAVVRDPFGGTSLEYRSNLHPQQVVTLAPPSAPTLQEPAAGSTVPDRNTPFRWSAYDGGVHVITWLSLTGGRTVTLFTESRSSRLSDLPVRIDGGSSYAWGVWGVGPAETIDDFASTDGGLPLPGLGRDLVWGVSPVWTFTSPN